jgi:hypothetical protein
MSASEKQGGIGSGANIKLGNLDDRNRLTPSQANALLESLRDEDDKNATLNLREGLRDGSQNLRNARAHGYEPEYKDW